MGPILFGKNRQDPKSGNPDRGTLVGGKSWVGHPTPGRNNLQGFENKYRGWGD
jgi:hypothetical protein